MNKIWTIQEDFSQEWAIAPSCFFKCTETCNSEQKRMLDRYAVKVAGDDPAKYGYVKIEGQGHVDSPDSRIVIAADSEEILDSVYNRVCASFINKPGVIDLRNIDCRII